MYCTPGMDSRKRKAADIKAKIKRAESANLKGFTSNKRYRRLTVKYSEMPANI